MLTWTRDKPKEPGWYWYRGPDGTIQLLHLTRVDEGACFEAQTKTAYPWEYFPGEWRGPMEPSTERNRPDSNLGREEV